MCFLTKSDQTMTRSACGNLLLQNDARRCRPLACVLTAIAYPLRPGLTHSSGSKLLTCRCRGTTRRMSAIGHTRCGMRIWTAVLACSTQR